MRHNWKIHCEYKQKTLYHSDFREGSVHSYFPYLSNDLNRLKYKHKLDQYQEKQTNQTFLHQSRCPAILPSIFVIQPAAESRPHPTLSAQSVTFVIEHYVVHLRTNDSEDRMISIFKAEN